MYPNYIRRRIMMCTLLMAVFTIIWDALSIARLAEQVQGLTAS
jgi:hypothetical protein